MELTRDDHDGDTKRIMAAIMDLLPPESRVRREPTEEERLFGKVSQIYQQTLDVLRVAKEQGIDSAAAADRVAEQRIAETRRAGQAWNPLRNAQR